MADIDIKGIGFAVKDIVLGVATAAAGATGGQAGAAGVTKAGDGLDKILAMTTGDDARAHRFDRADYGAKPARTAAQTPSPAPPAPTDREVAIAHLASMGWSSAQAEQILGGPQKYNMTQIAPTQAAAPKPPSLAAADEVKPVPLVEGRRVTTKNNA